MQAFLWMLVPILFTLTEGTIFHKRQSKKCQAVVMCPQFCLKIKDECYICECEKSLNTFMQDAMQHMKHDYDPIYQTGSKFVNLNMGPKDETSKNHGGNPNIRKSPWLNMGHFGANTFGGVMMGGVESISQTGHYLEPDFKEFYQPVGMVLPGRCPEMSYACPGRCWKTDGFSGCFRCECEDKHSTQMSQSARQTTSTAPSSEQLTPSVPSTTPNITPEPTTKQLITSSTVTSTEQITSQSANLQHINGSFVEKTKGTGSPPPTASKEFVPQNMNSQSGVFNANSGEKNRELEQLNALLNVSSGLTLTSKFSDGLGSKPSTGKGLVDLTGADLFKILITGIKERKSLQEVLYSLAVKVNQGDKLESISGQGHQNEKSEGQIQSENVSVFNNSKGEITIKDQPQNSEIPTARIESSLTSKSPEQVELRPSDVTTTTHTTEALLDKTVLVKLNAASGNSWVTSSNRKDCLDLGSSCPAECHVTDPVSSCLVCSCAHDINTTRRHEGINCTRLDASCPSRCITLDINMCPVCVCTDKHIDKATTQSTPPTNTVQVTTSSTTSTVCRITGEVRNCPSSCLKFDDHFCPVCICSDDVMNGTESPQKICPAVERGCPQRCLRFDQNYCAYCFCDSK